MEVFDTLRKSVLKKPDSTILNKNKKVTFCSTVKVFIDDIHPEKNINLLDSQIDCVEINIIDKSSDGTFTSDISKNDDCNATDFLVHKVVYNDDGDTDALSEDAEDSLILFNTSNDEEGLQFVVHKVTDHEDDLIQQELELEDNNSNDFEFNEVVDKLSELSIENILTHDKIIAFIDQKSLGLASLLKNHVNLSEIDALPLLKNPTNDIVDCSNDTSHLKNSEVVLSPPLQELSLDKIVKAQSNNVLCELDISPLNSIQETDSESDISSSGTVIMMTTEETEKNEQHIRESLHKYQSMKKQKDQTKDPAAVSNAQILSDSERKSIPEETTQNSYVSSSLEKFDTDHKETFSNCERDFPLQTYVQDIKDSNSEQWYPEHLKKTRSASLPINSKAQSYKDFSNTNVHESRRVSFTAINNSSWDTSLESVQIPKDVREWKITTSSAYKNSKDFYSADLSMDSSTLQQDEYFPSEIDVCPQNLSEMCRQTTCPKSDELESFVHASTERVQRIRKRYLDKSPKKIGLSTGSVRGIRPRFCSTAEILRMLQKKTKPPLLTLGNRHHVSWPWNENINNSENIQNKEQFSHMFGCQILPGEYSLQASLSSYGSEDSNSSTCDHDSVSSCPSIFFHERGVPEGASPPRSLSSDSIEKYTNEEESSSNVVYFSMKV